MIGAALSLAGVAVVLGGAIRWRWPRCSSSRAISSCWRRPRLVGVLTGCWCARPRRCAARRARRSPVRTASRAPGSGMVPAGADALRSALGRWAAGVEALAWPTPAQWSRWRCSPRSPASSSARRWWPTDCGDGRWPRWADHRRPVRQPDATVRRAAVDRAARRAPHLYHAAAFVLIVAGIVVSSKR